MSNNTFENLRNHNKPNRVEILFVGESRPQGGSFFYQEDSSLYRETKKAFNEYFAQDIFTLSNFKHWDCMLYDICENPINNLANSERRQLIHENISRVENLVKQELPKLIIVCKKTFVELEIKKSDIMNTFRDGENIFFLPFPGNGNQRKYREGLITILKVFNFEDHIAAK